MDALEFFEKIAKPNYEEAKRAPDDLRLLWNAVVSLNTIVEFVVLHRCNYEADLERNELLKKEIRKKIPELDYLNMQLHLNMYAEIKRKLNIILSIG
jgi:hypothetical protein